MDPLSLLPYLITLRAVAQQGGVRPAARALRVSQATVSRHLSRLEEGMGVRLIDRSPRHLRPTPAGEALIDRLADLEQALDGVLDAVDVGSPRGLVRLSAPSLMVTHLIAPALAGFHATHPQVELELIALDRNVGLIDAADVVIRIGPLADSAHACRHLLRLTPIVVCAPHRAPPTPVTAAALAEQPWVIHRPSGQAGRLLTGPDGQTWHLEPRSAIGSNDSSSSLALLEAGAGLGLMLDRLVAPALAVGRLVQLPWSDTPKDFFVVHSSGRLPTRAVRALVDWLVEHLADPQG